MSQSRAQPRHRARRASRRLERARVSRASAPGRAPTARPRPPARVSIACARAVLAYAVAYYALWAAADLSILAGRDAGWALRMLPNQLYYALFVPFAFSTWFALRRSTPRSAIG